MLIMILLWTALFFVLYKYGTRNFDFWKKRNIPYIEPLPFFGNILPLVLIQKQIGFFLKETYSAHRDKPYIGIFLADRPCLVVNDPSLVDTIFNQNHFDKRIFSPEKSVDPLGAQSLFALYGQKWKATRSYLSRGFTPAKLKNIFQQMIFVSNDLKKTLDSQSHFQAADLSMRFTVDVISTSVFGFNGKAIVDPDNDDMRKISKEIFSGTTYQAFKNNLTFVCPQVLTFLGIEFLTKNVDDFIRSTIQRIAAERTSQNIRRNDFMDMLLEQRKNGGWRISETEIYELEGDQLAAQLFMFVTAGFETSASALLFTFLELARNHELQDKVRNEINEVLSAHGDSISYESLKELKYMELVINETLRKYPSFPFLDLECTADHKLPGTDTIIPKGTYVLLPMLGFHNDERYWPSPEKYDPERFRDPAVVKDKPYFPFGAGARVCLGMRFTLMQIKLALIAVIRNHKLTTDRNEDISMDPRNFTLFPVNDVMIHVTNC